MLVKVQGFAMDGNGDLRPYPTVHVLQLRLPRMSGHVDELVAIGDDFDALPH